MPTSYDIIIQKVLLHLRSNISEPLNLAKIAKAAGCSKSWLVTIFMRHTGKGPVSHLNELRIEKAKELLRNTNLSISEIAASTGFNSQMYFSIAFKKATKFSPSGFRTFARNALDGGRAAQLDKPVHHLWFSDSMRNDSLVSRWKPHSGDWAQCSDCVSGTGEENVTLELKRLLPDNFRLSFEIRLDNLRGVPASMIGLFFCDQTTQQQFYTLRIHDLYGVECTLFRRGIPVQESAYSQIRTGAWHTFEVAQNDDSFSFLIDGEKRILFRDPFPAPYEQRCRLMIHVWRSRLSVRNVQIEDLGFLPFGRTIRQADALYNSGLTLQAMQVYRRMLDTETNPADITELHCKIGLCCLDRNDFAQAREWAQKMAGFPLNDFWAQQAALVLLEIDWRENRIPELLAQISALSKVPAICCRLKGIVQQAAADFDQRGYFEESLVLRSSLRDIEDEKSAQYVSYQALVCESLLQLNRVESAVAHLRELAKLGRVHNHANEFWLFTLADALNLLGKSAESIEIIRDMRNRTHDLVTRARCDVYEALCLRAQGKLNDAISLLDTVPANHPRVEGMVAFAKLCRSSILVSAGRPDEALSLVAEVAQSPEGDFLMGKGHKSRYEYPAFFAKEEYAKAAEILLSESTVDDAYVSLRARQALNAAMILSMAERAGECIRILEETARRFPEVRVRYFASLAHTLAKGIRGMDSPGWSGAVVPCFENLPYPAPIRSEMFFLAGSLFLHMGEKASGLTLLRQSAEEDPSNLWPAVLAKKRLIDNF